MNSAFMHSSWLKDMNGWRGVNEALRRRLTCSFVYSTVVQALWNADAKVVGANANFLVEQTNERTNERTKVNHSLNQWLEWKWLIYERWKGTSESDWFIGTVSDRVKVTDVWEMKANEWKWLIYVNCEWTSEHDWFVGVVRERVRANDLWELSVTEWKWLIYGSCEWPSENDWFMRDKVNKWTRMIYERWKWTSEPEWFMGSMRERVKVTDLWEL